VPGKRILGTLLVRCNALYKIIIYVAVLPYFAVFGFMVMACRWGTILRARRNHKMHGSSELYFTWTNHVLLFFPSFMVMVMVTADRWRRSNIGRKYVMVQAR
jgi:hypothetical protein